MNEPPASPPADRTRPGITMRTVVLAAVVALVVGGAVVAFATLGGSDDDRADRGLAQSSSVVGTRTEVRYTTFDGESASTRDHMGHPMVVNFFAEWCPPCVAEMPDFEAVHQEVADEIHFLGLSTMESADAATGLIERTGITYDVGRDTDGRAFSDVGGIFMPTTVFIDATGTIVDVHSGALSADQLRRRIDDLLR